MSTESCIFCKIIAKQIPAQPVAETENLIVLKDIAPKAPIHYLIIPKKHIANVSSLSDLEAELAGKMLIMAGKLSKELKNPSFKVVVNSGTFQHVPHLHMHFLAGGHIDTV